MLQTRLHPPPRLHAMPRPDPDSAPPHALPAAGTPTRLDSRLAAAALAVGTACLYSYGLTYHQGYLSAWGLEEGLFPLSVDRTVFQGFVAASHLGAVTLLPLLAAALVLLLAALLGAWGLSGWRAWQARRRATLRPQRQTPGAVVDAADAAARNLALLARVALWIYGATVVFAVIVGLMLSADRLGRAAAAQQARGLASSAPVTVKPRLGDADTAQLVLCSSSHCAFWRAGQVQVRPVSDLALIERAAPLPAP